MTEKGPRVPYQGTTPVSAPGGKVDATWFTVVLARLVKACLKEPGNKDLHALARAVSSLVTAARGFILRAELDAEVAELRQQVLAMMSAGKYGSRVATTANAGVATPVRSDDPLH